MYFLKSTICVALITIFGFLESDAGKIFNGVETDPHAYPWVVWFKIGIRRVHCAGALITDKYVLTSASCAASNDIVAVIAGDHIRSTNEGYEQEFAIKEVFVHSEYNDTTFENDVAIVELDGTVDTSIAQVDVAPVLFKNDKLVARVMRKHCRVVGWGNVPLGDSNLVRDQSDVLLEYKIDIQNSCSNVSAPSTAFCFEPFRSPNSVFCKGDIGGPVMCKRKRIWNIVGVMSGFDIQNGCKPGQKAATLLTDFTRFIRPFAKS